MDNIKIIIPSAGRFFKPIQTLNHIAHAIICVPESEEGGYKLKNPQTEIVAHPDSVRGMGAKRNWITETFGDVFMIDDDIFGIRKNCIPYYEKSQILNKYEAYDMVQFLGETVRGMGGVLFGFGNAVNGVMFRPQQPFILTGYINGACIGVLKNDTMRFNENITGANDYYISALNAYHYRFMLKDMRFVAVQKGVGNAKGGLSRYRNEDTEKADTILLRKTFGGGNKTQKSE